MSPSNIFVGEKCGQIDTATSPQRFILKGLHFEQIMENHIRLLPLFGQALCLDKPYVLDVLNDNTSVRCLSLECLGRTQSVTQQY